MKLKNFFSKDIFRHIEGVIKADDREYIAEEVREYVITNEIQKKINTFFEVYSSSIGNPNFRDVGVWISGFFGSGKSHLLKILSFILNNEMLEGFPIGDAFLSKVEDDFELQQYIKKAMESPSKTILFNIDQKADIVTNKKRNALLSVFMKVFNEELGYYPKYGYVANFERDLDKQGLYSEFKETFASIAEESWEEGRESINLNMDFIAETLADVKKISVENGEKIINNYREDYSLSIEDFAGIVKSYVDIQQKDFRLIFCIDEIGQFISEDTQLMLDLQTISETLSTVCKGQVWVMVTSQDDIETLTGNMNAKQSNDFSRIQARFPTRINLSSANVDEVIKKRLLAKNSDAESKLADLYEKETSNIRTLFHFSQTSFSYRNYRDEDDFLLTYPFVPYQFELFQSSIRGLSLHNAFQGRHQSVGERSMLGVFQLVLQKNAEAEIGTFSMFDQLYDGINNALRGEVQAPINRSINHISNDFYIRVLKALFLVKYVKEFKSDKRNISVLLIDSINCDVLSLEREVQEAFNHLESQTLIQHIGDQYEFLTNEEKEVEENIKMTEIESSDVNKLLHDTIFNTLIRDTKIRYSENNQDYSFTKRIDDRLYNREEDLSVHFITPLYPENSDEKQIRLKSISKTSELIILMADDRRLGDDLKFYKQTEKYIKHSTRSGINQNTKVILALKATQNKERFNEITNRIDKLIIEGKAFLKGSLLSPSLTNTKAMLIDCFGQLIKSTFPNLRMLKKQFRERDVKEIIYSSANSNDLSEAENETLSLILRKFNRNELVTVKTLLSTFSSKPYGWYQSAVLSQIALLYAKGKIELERNFDLDKKAVYESLSNNRFFDTTIIKKITEVNSQQISKVIEFYMELFHEPIATQDAKELHKRFSDRLQQEIGKLEIVISQNKSYSFLEPLKECIKDYQKLENLNLSSFYNSYGKFEDSLLDKKESVIDPILNFLQGDKKIIYDDVITFLNFESANINYVENELIEPLASLKEEGKPYRGSLIKNSKPVLRKVKEEIQRLLEMELKRAYRKIEKKIEGLKSFDEFEQLKNSDKTEILRVMKLARTKLNEEKYISNIRERTFYICNDLYEKQIEKMYQLIKKDEPKVSSNADVKKTTTKTSVRLNKLMTGNKHHLKDENEVNEFINDLKTKLLNAINDNKIITF